MLKSLMNATEQVINTSTQNPMIDLGVYGEYLKIVTLNVGLGMVIKNIPIIKNNYIPLCLCTINFFLILLYNFSLHPEMNIGMKLFTAITQAPLCWMASWAVYEKVVKKQLNDQTDKEGGDNNVNNNVEEETEMSKMSKAVQIIGMIKTAQNTKNMLIDVKDKLVNAKEKIANELKDTIEIPKEKDGEKNK